MTSEEKKAIRERIHLLKQDYQNEWLHARAAWGNRDYLFDEKIPEAKRLDRAEEQRAHRGSIIGAGSNAALAGMIAGPKSSLARRLAMMGAAGTLGYGLNYLSSYLENKGQRAVTDSAPKSKVKGKKYNSLIPYLAAGGVVGALQGGSGNALGGAISGGLWGLGSNLDRYLSKPLDPKFNPLKKSERKQLK